jgi:uncharacterized membrane protein YphA (DoxX/SURF4 family)
MKLRPILYTLLRVALGVVFVWASWEKILHPQAFADIVRNYQVVPEAFVHPVALGLPWLEALCGVLLIMGRWVDGSLLIVNASLVVFIAALAWNGYRGLDVSCGCFSVSADYRKGDYLIDITRDIGLLAAGLWLAYYRILTLKAQRTG